MRDTMFAPGERADNIKVMQDYNKFISIDPLHQVTNSMPCMVMILNKERQLVYFNHLLKKSFNNASENDILGKRPGELLNCIHADNEYCGCGTSEFCKECGAVNAILQSQNLSIITCFECRITSKNSTAHDLRVWASPYVLKKERYTVFSVIDISNEKRKEVLEKTFFHDINNMLMLIIGYSTMLKYAGENENKEDYIDLLHNAGVKLSEEIASQQRLLQAENGSLCINPVDIDSFVILQELSEMYSKTNTWQNKKVVIDLKSERFTFKSDRTLFFRILSNMIKNALEASCDNANVELMARSTGRNVEFSVRNKGCIERSAQLQIFQRSFSTKGKGRGTGTYSMKLFGEKYLKGRVWFKSDKNSDTTFYLSVPIDFSSRLSTFKPFE